MAFVLPTFNLTCDIYSWGSTIPGTPRIANQPCQLRAPSLTTRTSLTGLTVGGMTSYLLLPPGVDIRDMNSTPISSGDFVEVPSGSGRVYLVIYVDDIARGFPNEHRLAILTKNVSFPWPVPTP